MTVSATTFTLILFGFLSWEIFRLKIRVIELEHRERCRKHGVDPDNINNPTDLP